MGDGTPGGDAEPSGFILLTMLDEWVAAHPASEDCIHRTVPELLQEFLRAFAIENTSAEP
ncbi:MAG TPA: hypothetical protein VHT28_09835 [Silvibacterium sp.]|nr:hypothetical protein [Silvibacterium sp.]